MSISWEYLAGMIDADGSIGTTRTGKNRNVIGRVALANTNHEFLKTIQAQFDGNLYLSKKGSKPGWKPYGSLHWTNRFAEKILIEIIPFLIIKQEQGKLCLELIQMKDLSKRERYDYVPSPTTGLTGRVVAQLKPEIRKREDDIGALIRSLNTKGVPIDAI